MKTFGIRALSAAAAGALLLTGGSAFAANEPNSALTIDYVSVPTISHHNHTYTYTVKVSGLTVKPKSTGESNYVGFRYGHLPPGNNDGDDSGHQVRGTFPVTKNGQFTLTIQSKRMGGPAGLQLDAAEYSTHSTSPGETDGKEIRQESPGVVLPGPTPFGQLPEVPFAVAIPVVGLGAAWLLRRRLAH